MAIRVVRLGTPRLRGEGLRIGTVRHPPRGVAKRDYAARDFFDVWLPELAPSAALVREARAATGDAAWRRFAGAYRKEMRAPTPSHLLDLLAALSHRTDFSVGCYCERFDRCHRSILAELLISRGARLVPPADAGSA